jgi:hypothetical protein
VYPNKECNTSIEIEIISKNFVFFIFQKTQTSLVFGKQKTHNSCCGFFIAEKEGLQIVKNSAISPECLIRYSLNAGANIGGFYNWVNFF